MKYYIITDKPELTLFKVPNDLVESFEQEHGKAIVSTGNSIHEVLIAFEQHSSQAKDLELSPKVSKYKTGTEISKI